MEDEPNARRYRAFDFKRDDGRLDLTGGEKEILGLLLERPGRIVTREVVARQTNIHSYEFFVSKLNKKLGHKAIVPEAGVGYRLAATGIEMFGPESIGSHHDASVEYGTFPFSLVPEALTPGSTVQAAMRLLTGTHLNMEDVAEGFGVDRRLVVARGRELGLGQVSAWLESQRGTVLLLEADAGEGKSTYRSLLQVRLRRMFTLVDWQVDSGFDGAAFDHLLKHVQGRDALSSRPMLLIGEIPPFTKSDVLEKIAASLQGNPQLRDVVLFLAGRPAEVIPLARQLDSALVVRLASLDEAESILFIDQLSRAYRLLSGTLETAQLPPNIQRFVNQPRKAQLETFLSRGNSVLVALLMATYGPKYWERLVAEFQKLKELEKLTYLAISLASAAGSSIPEVVLEAMFPGSDLDGHCQASPWLRLPNGSHVARHALIGQTVVEASKVWQQLREVMGRVIAHAPQGAEEYELCMRLLDAAERWQPLQLAHTEVGGHIRRITAEAINAQQSAFGMILPICLENASELLDWAGLLHRLLPDKPSPNDEALLRTSQLFLSEAAIYVAPGSPVFERIEYYHEKAEWRACHLLGESPDLERDMDLVRKLATLLERSWPKADYFLDLFYQASSIARSLTFNPTEPPGSDRLMEFYTIAVVSFEKARLSLSHDEIRGHDSAYSELVGRFIHKAFEGAESRRAGVLESAWNVSADTSSPNPQTATNFAKSVGAIDAEEGRSVLRRLVMKVPHWGEAWYELGKLCETASQRQEHEPLFRQAIADNGATGIARALLHHGAALAETDPRLKISYLEIALQGYCDFVKSRLYWDGYHSHWEAATTELRTKGVRTTEYQSCLQAARRQFSPNLV